MLKKPESQPNQMFSFDYAASIYDHAWVKGANIYEPLAKIQVELASRMARKLNLPNSNLTVVDLGAGTGNSMWVEATHTSGITQLIGIDLSLSMLLVAQHKLGKLEQGLWQELTKNIDLAPAILERNHQISTELALVQQQVALSVVNGRGNSLPLASESVDRLHAEQSLHWMAFAPSDTEGKDPRYLLYTLKEIRRVLKTGGLFIFDEGSLQFKFKEDQYNSYNLVRHPFYLAYKNNLLALFRERGLSPARNDQKINQYDHMFDINNLAAMLHEAKLSLIPMNNRLYHVYIQDKTSADLIKTIKDGSNMTLFTSPELQNLRDETKKELIEQAYQTTLNQDALLLKVPAKSAFAFFVAQAI